jgi:NADH dehydrogenase
MRVRPAHVGQKEIAAIPMNRVIITGGTGYVGCHLIDALSRRSVEIVALARKSAPDEAKQFLRSLGARIHEVDFESGESLSAQFVGSKVWIHLIGSIQRLRSDSFEHRHRELSARLIAQAKRAGVGRVVFLTALGTVANANNDYHRTKWEAERQALEAQLAGALVRPGLICGRAVGPRDSKLVLRYINMIRAKGKATVLGQGRNLVQPIDVRDVVRCLIEAAERENNMAIHEIAGPERVEFQEFVRRLARAMGRPVQIVHFPLWLAAMAARLYELYQEKPILTREHVILAQQDAVCPLDSVERRFGFRPRPLAESLATYGESGN